MKKIVLWSLFYLVIAASTLSLGFNYKPTISDDYLREQVSILQNFDGSSCTAVQIQTPTGKYFTLSAAHCFPLQVMPGYMMATYPGNFKILLRIVKVDEASDLMLMSPARQSGIPLAKTIYLHEHVHTMTHGGGMPVYRTDGELIDLTFPWPFATGHYKLIGTAGIIPGSSGGPLVDDEGSLVGIATNLDGRGFAYFTPLSDLYKIVEDL